MCNAMASEIVIIEEGSYNKVGSSAEVGVCEEFNSNVAFLWPEEGHRPIYA